MILEKNTMPQHVAIIMDGNGRWAKKRFMPRAAGHRAGADAVEQIVSAAASLGIKVLTLFAFSSENWQRPAEEVDQLMNLFLTRLEKKLDELNEKNVKLRFIGDLSSLSVSLQQRFLEAAELTKKNSSIELVIAVNYGGQWDILQACKKVYQAMNSGTLKLAELTENQFNDYLSTQGLPPPDLFIRTSGELRISNFLLWQLAYTEFYFTDVLWPDFDAKELKLAINEFEKRRRRFGKTDAQIESI